MMYSWSLNNAGVRDTDCHTVKFLCNFRLPRNLSCPLVSVFRGLVPGPLWMLKSLDTQVPYVKNRSAHTVCPPRPGTPNCDSKTVQIFIEKLCCKWSCSAQAHVVQGSMVIMWFLKGGYSQHVILERCN